MRPSANSAQETSTHSYYTLKMISEKNCCCRRSKPMKIDMCTDKGYDVQVGHFYRAYLVFDEQQLRVGGFHPTREIATKAAFDFLKKIKEAV